MLWRRKSGEDIWKGRFVVKLRCETSYPIIKGLEWCKEEYEHTVDKSPVAKAIFYMYTRFEQLSGYVNDARFCIDNNPVERSIRPLTLNRKKYLFSGAHEAAHAAAIFFSLMGCCRENKVNPKLWMVTCRLGYRIKKEKRKTTTPIYCHLIGRINKKD